MLDLSKYDHAVYDESNYNCLHFAVALYQDLSGKDMGVYVSGMMTGRDHRTINPGRFKQLRQLTVPESPCVAVMHSQTPHAGVFYFDTIIHFNESGINCQPPHIAELKHGRISYYAI